MRRPSDPSSVIQGMAHGAPHGLVQRQTSTLSTHHPHPGQTGMMMDPSQMGHHRMGTPTYGGHGSIITPIYQAMPTSQEQQARRTPTGAMKRPRPPDLDLQTPHHGVSSLDHPDLASLHQAPMGTAYSQASTTPGAMPHHHPTHHHHRLPDSASFAKVVRREDTGGAPSVVGQEGMPEPARRPKGPKLKFTSEDDQLLIELKEQKNLTWKQIADFFPGRSSGTLQVRYCTKLKAKTKQWNDDMDQKLRKALDDYENEKWRVVSSKLGTGFTPAACRDRADQLWGDAPLDDIGDASSVPSAPDTSVVETSQEFY